jgi:hypothetical protein
MRYQSKINCATEWTFTAKQSYADPFNEIELDVIFTGPDGKEKKVPTFWAGGAMWKIRYAAPVVGAWRWRSVCSNPKDEGLHDVEGTLDVALYDGDNLLLRRGPLRVSADKRYLEHGDGTPFFWLADTWWMALCKRLSWPGDFSELVADRVGKDFSVVQFVAGLFPDMPAFDERGLGDGGFPWEKDFARINPKFFDMADLRVHYLVEQGLLPCVLACWGYYLPWLGVEKMKKHWRYLIARWGAYPVVWCLAGEGSMPYYLSEDKDGDRQKLVEGWSELAAYVRRVDPYGHPLTVHPSRSAREVVNDDALIDFDMLQTGHGDRQSLAGTLGAMQRSYANQYRMPVLNGEVCYEGIGEACRQEVQRLMFWVCMLSGACGHSYGANGIWQVNRPNAPYGPSPHGRSWGNTPWREAMQWLGSEQLGLSKRFLAQYEWHRFAPHPEWVENHATPEHTWAPYAGGIEGGVRMVFLPSGVWGVTVCQLEKNVRYRAFLFDPTKGEKYTVGLAQGDAAGKWKMASTLPVFQDWVLVLEAE